MWNLIAGVFAGFTVGFFTCSLLRANGQFECPVCRDVGATVDIRKDGPLMRWCHVCVHGRQLQEWESRELQTFMREIQWGSDDVR